MKRRTSRSPVAFLLAVVSLFAGAAAGLQAAVAANEATPRQGDRILVLAPHPDDETLACGGIIQKAVAINVPVRVVILTYGDDNEWSFLIYRKFFVYGSRAVEKMGLVRDEEAHRAAAKLGLRPDQITFLGYPDHALQSIWFAHWSGQPPAVGPLSRARQVPYADAYRPGAPYTGEDIVKDLASILREFRPTKVFLSHPADRHPDHRSLYVFTRVALWDVEGDLPRPRLFPYLVHFSGWPEKTGLHPSLMLDPAPALRDGIHWLIEALDEREVAIKLEALRLHKSQHESAGPFLDSFVRGNELFGDFPDLDASRENAGPEDSHVCVRDGRLVIEVDMPPAEMEKARFSFRAFGYRRDVPFGRMPKLRIRVSGPGHEIFEGKNKIGEAAVTVGKGKATLAVALPLELLGRPEKVLLGTRSPLLTRPVSYFSWRVIALTGAGPGASRGRRS